MLYSFPPTIEEFIDHKDEYVVPLYDLANIGIYADMPLSLGTQRVLTAYNVADVESEYVVLYDWCTQFGERYQTIVELLDALLLRWTQRHHISGVDPILPLHWVEPNVTVSIYDYFGSVITHTYNDVVCITKDVAYDLTKRLSHSLSLS